MQHRHRNSRRDRRSPPRSGCRNFVRRDGNGFGRQPCHPPNPSSRDPAKEEIFKKAGKLAAKYLVSKGLLSPSALKRKRERTGKRFDGGDGGVRRWDSREHHRRRFDDGGDDCEERRRRQWRRDDGGGEGENEADCGSGEVRWTGRRPWGCYDVWENDGVEREGDYRRKRFRRGPRPWLGRSEEARSRDGADEEYRWRAGSSRGRREFRREEGLDLGLKKTGDRDDDTSSYESGEVRGDDHEYWYGGNEGERENGDELLELSRAEELGMDGDGGGLLELLRAEEVRMDGGGGSSNNSREEPAAGFTIDLNKAASEGGLESDGDGEMEITDELRERSQGSLDMDIRDNVDVKSAMSEEFDGADSRDMSKDDSGDDLLKLCSFTDVPTKPRTALAGRGVTKINELFLNEVNVVGEIAAEVPKANVEGLVVEGLSTDLRKDQANTSRGEESGVSSNIFDKHVEESVNQQHEVIKSSELLINVNEETQAVEELEIKRVSVDEELVAGHVGGQEKPVRDDSSPEFKLECNIKMELGQQPQPIFFKVCDLNLMAPPEENEAEDDLVSDHLNACMPVSEASRDLPLGFGHSAGIVPNETDVQCLFSRDKVIPVIDLEDVSSNESSDHDSPNSENDTWYSSVALPLENGDLHGADRGCSAANPEFLQADILGYPLPPSEPQAGMGFSVQRFCEGWGSSDSAAGRFF